MLKSSPLIPMFSLSVVMVNIHFFTGSVEDRGSAARISAQGGGGGETLPPPMCTYIYDEYDNDDRQPDVGTAD